MSMFNDNERAQEARFAHSAETEFRVVARRNRLVGAWAAGLMGLSEAEADAYAKAVVQADFEEAGDEDVMRKLIGDLLKAGVDVSEADVRSALADSLTQARAQIQAAG